MEFFFSLLSVEHGWLLMNPRNVFSICSIAGKELHNFLLCYIPPCEPSSCWLPRNASCCWHWERWWKNSPYTSLYRRLLSSPLWLAPTAWKINRSSACHPSGVPQTPYDIIVNSMASNQRAKALYVSVVHINREESGVQRQNMDSCR